MESLVHYSNPSHALSVLGFLNEQRLRGQLCDTVLVVGDQRYQAHRSILASSSEYFQSLYSQRASEPHSVVQLDFCEPDAFEIVLNYIYSSSLFVDKGSLAAIQELGYSLGIPFLTNIMSAKPHVSYCVSRKKLSFTEEDRHDCQTKSVIVCQNRDNTPVPSCLNYREKTSEKSSTAPHSVTEQRQSLSHESVKTSESNVRKAIEITDKSDSKTNHPYTSILKGKSTHTTSMRPQLTTSVSFSDAEIQHTRLPSDLCMKEEDEESFNSPKTNSQKKVGEPSHAIDRSGPLIKSLLRRSLSMDSPVPVFSPALELKKMQNREQSVVHLMAETPGPVHSNLEHSSKGVPPLILRSKYQNRPYDKEHTQVDVVNVKAEPSSPLADPSDIIRITVGDSLPVNLKDFQMNYDQGPRTILHLSGKRKVRADNRRYPFKKFKVLPPADDVLQSASQIPDIDNRGKDLEEPRQCKVFKCWNCLKVFRSNAGLHRHVNMYHNPEKPYACEICHKRFHTNFKVWTHCQTQHGVVQNPASSSTSSVLDEKFQRKLIDVVREREIKKALLWKLKRNKQGLQSHSSAKKRSRTSFMCPYCGKVFLFESQFKRHLKTHPAKRTEQDAETEDMLYHKPEQLTPERENTDTEVFSCRLCNVKLSSLFEQGDHERGCRHATVCPYCGLRFSSPSVKKDHEAHCKFKKLTCLECMRTFKSSFSIWRHQVEVHNHNIMTVKEQMSLDCQENNGAVSELLTKRPDSHEPDGAGSSREDIVYSDSSGPPMFDSEDSSSFVPEDLSMGQHHGNLVVKEEPMEEAVCDGESIESATAGLEEPGVWPCEKCSKLFGCHKDLERHQELLCHIKPFICHICNKAFRTNFRLWSHFQSHMSTSDEVGAREVDRRPSSPSPSPPLTPHVSGHPVPQASPPKTSQTGSTAEEEPHSVAVAKTKISEVNRQDSSHSPLSRTDSVENPPQESDTLFYHAPTLSALTFKRQYMCKLCHRTFKTAFSLWSHEQSHSQL